LPLEDHYSSDKSGTVIAHFLVCKTGNSQTGYEILHMGNEAKSHPAPVLFSNVLRICT
jgi:hypothetical protein